MAKRKRSRSKKYKGKKLKVHPKFAGKSYDCHGKHVRSGKSRTKRPRVFCGKPPKK